MSWRHPHFRNPSIYIYISIYIKGPRKRFFLFWWGVGIQTKSEALFDLYDAMPLQSWKTAHNLMCTPKMLMHASTCLTTLPRDYTFTESAERLNIECELH